MTLAVVLKDGPFDGVEIASVEWGVTLSLDGPPVPDGMVARYRPTRERGVYRFRGYARVLLRVPTGDAA
jgi:hypothetical protein